MSALALRGVWKTRGQSAQSLPALRDVSLSVDAGEFVLIEGPSGVGKTTLLAVSAGLLLPDSGDVELAGKMLGTMSGSEQRQHRARSVGFVFQRFNLLEALSVRENVLLTAALAGMSALNAGRATDELLERLGIASLRSRRPATLSGGEEQRTAIARALVHSPAVVFADEPTGSLDSASGRVVAESLQAIAHARGAAVVGVTHDPRLAQFATRRLQMSDGRLVTAGG